MPKWTLEECLTDAQRYKTVTEWRSTKGSGFAYARAKGWLDECRKHMVHGKIKWTKESCIEDAQQHQVQTHWQISKGGAYNAAVRYGWLSECTEHMPSTIKGRPKGPVKWTEAACADSAKSYEYLNEWKKGCPGAWGSAKKNGWLNDIKRNLKTGGRPKVRKAKKRIGDYPAGL